jgi:putative endonuclease
VNPANSRKQATHDFGRRAETAALFFLMFRGWRILARRYRAPGGEVDLVAMRGSTIAFVEVKARADLDAARLAIDEEKRRRICSAARHWIGRRAADGSFVLRGDAVFVARWRLPVHLTDAFRLDLDDVRRL